MKENNKKEKLDHGGSTRDWPGPHGSMISKNPDLGSGPFSQKDGKPYGGVPAGEFIKKKRKRRYSAKGKLMAQLNALTDELYKAIG